MLVIRLRAFIIATVIPFIFSLLTALPGSGQTVDGKGNTDVFVLPAAAATTNIQEAAVISDFDWFSDGDKIGLTDGLTESDLDYMELIDFDEDGLSDDTVIKIKSTQEILGVVLNADDFVLDGEFVPVSSQKTLISCLQKANSVSCELPTIK